MRTEKLVSHNSHMKRERDYFLIYSRVLCLSLSHLLPASFIKHHLEIALSLLTLFQSFASLSSTLNHT